MFLALCALVIATPFALRAQDETNADFVLARKQFVAGQPRAAANTLVMSSLAVRQQVGRCRDEEIGSRLMEAEQKLEKISASLKAGSITSVKTLDQALTDIDRSLAKHPLLLAQQGIVRPRAEDLPVLSRDIERAAFHFERSITLDGHTLAAEQASAVADARKVSDQIDETKAVPAETKVVLAALEKQITAVSSVASAK
jgi:hypothetical protein